MERQSAQEKVLKNNDLLRLVLVEVATCSLSEIVTVRLVCREWNDIVSTKAFWHALLDSCIDNGWFLPEEESEKPLFLWREDGRDDTWDCFWTDADDASREQYVFRPMPYLAHCGVVFPANHDARKYPNPRDFLIAIHGLQTIKQFMDETEWYFSYSSESESEALPIVIPWELEREPTPKEVFGRLGAHPQIMQALDDSSGHDRKARGIPYMGLSFFASDGILEKMARTLLPDGRECALYRTEPRLNPVPILVLDNSRDGFLAGFLTSAIWT